MYNRIIGSLTVILVLCFAHEAVYGQGRRGGPGGRGGTGRLEASGLKVGSPMPEVTVFDAEGKPFDTKSLKGNYSVIVFGCLT